MSGARGPTFVIDDDPTGAQGQAGVPLLLEWDVAMVEAAVREGAPAIHLLTNSRALDEDGAYATVRNAVETVASVVPDPDVLLRGDSTLRAHLLPEYAAVRDALWPATAPPLLLVPALPSAGRITRDGMHWLIREGERVPLEETEFATDGNFAYSSSRLAEWAEERSGGYFPAAAGISIGLDSIRADDGAATVCRTLLEAASGPERAVVVPDAETTSDLETVAAGLVAARERSAAIVVRSGPAFASVLSGAGATDVVPLPSVDRGLLVVVGSHVPMSTAQLAQLNACRPGSLVELDAATLAGDDGESAIAAAAARARSRLSRDRLAVVATQRTVEPKALGPDAGMRVARGLAKVVGALRDSFDVLLSKGGITSAVNVGQGLDVKRARILGPVANGIALWEVYPAAGKPRPVIVFPGNVGDADELAEIVQLMIGD